ncbi:histidinol-phosphatase [uncultured Psychrobacter sp.]|uniref:histidinol-phosphatase n=1 Tax=uncultured Psychrobacter sp. TaxID=259303 RepID=UPI003458C13D
MIDSHTHTHYSKHAVGSVNELVEAAIVKGVKILTITDHAPFYVDSKNRLLETELNQYFEDINRAKEIYRDDIVVLTGLELDFMPDSYSYLERMLSQLELDFVIGSIHYIPIKNETVKVWDLAHLNKTKVLNSYFTALRQLIESNLFDVVGHPDTILRSVSEDVYWSYMEPLLPLFKKNNTGYELNTSGLRKSSFDIELGQKTYDKWSYPSKLVVAELIKLSTALTIGSDAHDPVDVGKGLQEIISELIPIGLKNISYFKSRQRIDVEVA